MKKNSIVIYLIIISIFAYFCLTRINVNNFEKVYDLVFTYLSITVGFVITSITIIASSGFSKKLYEKQSGKDNSKTLLHELLQRFRFALTFFCLPMILILVSPLISWEKWVYGRKIYNTVVIIMTFLTFPVLINQFRVMMKFIIQNINLSQDNNK